MEPRNLTLLTDLYELTMMQGYFREKDANETVIFDAFYRTNPDGNAFSICAGLEQVIDYVKNLHFDDADIEYLRGLGIFDEDFLEYLHNFKFSGDIYAIPEGTVVFPREPLVKVIAPIMEAQLVETAILNIINHQSLIATKTSRIVFAARGDGIMEFGLRRAQGADAGTYGARAAMIAGCIGTLHAAAYAVVSYQTAYLKYYHPVEFMAALMTSVKDNVTKVSEYIMSCRQMGMKIMPPDINEGEGGFSVSDGAIRYGLSAIKSIGQSVVDEIVRERTEHGKFRSLEDFIDRMSGREVNKRTLESFIKSGAMDGLPGTRKQKCMVCGSMVDQKNKEKKNTMEGQMSLFDFAAEEDKKSFQITFPNVGEYSREEYLAYEKEMLGVYVSGHPLEEYIGTWEKNVTAKSSDFVVDEETGSAVIHDGAYVTIGGMITEKTVKTTRNNKMMAFLTVEDLAGSVEVLVFPKDYEKRRDMLIKDEKVFIRGRASVGDEPVGKLICEQIIPFSQVPRELWIQYADKDAYLAGEKELLDLLKTSDGNDTVIIYLGRERAKKILPRNWNVRAGEALVTTLSEMLGEKNVKVVEKPLGKISS